MLIAKEGLDGTAAEAEKNIDGKYGMLIYSSVNGGLSGNYIFKPYVEYKHDSTGATFYVYGADIAQEI